VIRMTTPFEPSTIVVVLGGVLDRADLPRLSDQLHASLQHSDAKLVVCDVGGLVDPDAVAVDAVVRLQLTARRLGRAIRLRRASLELQELLAFLGLEDVVPLGAPSLLEPRRQAEEREQARGVEEERDPADPGAR
jgi:ABC-type transporter Mla MlaB component